MPTFRDHALNRHRAFERGLIEIGTARRIDHLPAIHDKEVVAQLVRKIEIVLPIYSDSPRSRLEIRVGLMLYDLLAGRHNIARHRPLTKDEILACAPLTPHELRGGFSYWDAQVDDNALVRTVVDSAARDGATIRERTAVVGLEHDGDGWIVRTNDDASHFDMVINAAGPWMNELLERNGIRARYRLSLVRGSHLILKKRVSDYGLLLQSATDRRVFFVLPWKGTTLVGTTEVVQTEPPDSVHASEEEIEYLLARFNRYFRDKLTRDGIESTFAGVRPLVGRSANPSAIGREYRVIRRENLINVFGGKMTTFMSLAKRVSMRVDNYFGRTREAREPIFATQ